eukprot:1249264-Amphidinium_carterae.1
MGWTGPQRVASAIVNVAPAGRKHSSKPAVCLAKSWQYHDKRVHQVKGTCQGKRCGSECGSGCCSWPAQACWIQEGRHNHAWLRQHFNIVEPRCFFVSLV